MGGGIYLKSMMEKMRKIAIYMKEIVGLSQTSCNRRMAWLPVMFSHERVLPGHKNVNAWARCT